MRRMLGWLSVVKLTLDSFSDAKARFEASPVTLLNADFLELASTAIRPVDVVLANPPFTRNHRLPVVTRRTLRGRWGFRGIVAGAPGLWVYFMLASLQFLKLGGRFAFIAPRTIEFADYATPLLELLRDSFQSVTLLSVEGPVGWDGPAEVRAVLVLAAGFGMGSVPRIRKQSLSLTTGETTTVSTSRKRTTLLPSTLLGNLADIEIGIVTGANATFVLNEADAAANKPTTLRLNSNSVSRTPSTRPYNQQTGGFVVSEGWGANFTIPS